MEILHNTSLKPYNTFGINANAKLFVSITTIEDLADLITSHTYKSENQLILGGGSNILLTSDFDGIVIKNNLKGIDIVKDDLTHCYVKVQAGEIWHQFVLHCISSNWAGVENLSLIPGNVGATPMQNIGAYGVEIKDVFESLEAINRLTGDIEVFFADDCNFGYRDSIFKKELKDEYIITSVTYRLSKTPTYNTSYGAIEQELENMGIEEVSIRAISQAVTKIRSAKLPNPTRIGNAGSFFKNPIVSAELFEKIRNEHENTPNYPAAEDQVKLAAAWLIEKAGWKGKTYGNYGVHKNQALVLVNYGEADGQKIYDLSTEIKLSVKEKFGVDLEREVNIV